MNDHMQNEVFRGLLDKYFEMAIMDKARFDSKKDIIISHRIEMNTVLERPGILVKALEDLDFEPGETKIVDMGIMIKIPEKGITLDVTTIPRSYGLRTVWKELGNGNSGHLIIEIFNEDNKNTIQIRKGTPLIFIRIDQDMRLKVIDKRLFQEMYQQDLAKSMFKYEEIFKPAKMKNNPNVIRIEPNYEVIENKEEEEMKTLFKEKTLKFRGLYFDWIEFLRDFETISFKKSNRHPSKQMIIARVDLATLMIYPKNNSITIHIRAKDEELLNFVELVIRNNAADLGMKEVN